MSRTVTVEAPARLHFGMLDLAGSLGRRFGGIGAGIPRPSLVLGVSRSDVVSAAGPDAHRAAEYARRFLAHHGLSGGARISVRQAIPAHAGLGSGTQLGLGVARALAELHGLPTHATELARAIGRARRSAIGTWLFELGGFVLEGGRRADVGGDEPAPLLAHHHFPESWRCVVAIPRAAPGVSGEAESAAFASLAPPPVREVERVAHLVLMSLLPALVEGDIASFGTALTEIQCLNGRWFSPAQHGEFAPGPSGDLVRLMRDHGAPGVGQSSWGPTIYGIVEGDAAADALARIVREHMAEGDVFVTPFARRGAVAS